jgi:hypothetical protein
MLCGDNRVEGRIALLHYNINIICGEINELQNLRLIKYEKGLKKKKKFWMMILKP